MLVKSAHEVLDLLGLLKGFLDERSHRKYPLLHDGIAHIGQLGRRHPNNHLINKYQ